MLYSTYLGGSAEDAIIGVTTDASDSVYVAGYTGSADFPVTTGCAQATFGGPYDTFITKFNLASPGPASLIYSTYLGGSNLEDPKGIAVDSAGNAYVAGYTQSNDFPVTQSLGATGFLNAFVARLNASGSQFLDSVRFGDTYTYAYGLALDSSGNAYVVGQTTAYSFPVTPGAVQPTLAGGGSDSFVTKLDFVTRQADLAVNFRPGPPQVTPGSPDIYVMDVSNNGPHQANNVILTDELPAGVSFISASPTEGASGSCTAAGNTVTCELGNLNPNSSAAVIVVVNVTAASGTTLVNVASVSSTATDPNTTNNSASVITEVLALADLSINATVQPQNFVANGASITYTVNATNSGPNTASAATISGTLPSAVTFNNIVNSYGTCTTAPDGNGTVHFDCSLGDTDSGITKTITFAGVVNGAPYTQLPFLATVGSATQDPADYNNNAATGVQISSPPLPAPTPGPGGDAQLAYAIHDPNTFQGDIFRQRADGAGLLNLTNNASAYGEFIWSPDGSRLAFVRAEQFGNDAHLYVMNADGTNRVRLTNDSSEQDSGVAWSPDGTRLAFTAYYPIGSTTGVHTINADGSNPRVLTTTTGNDSSIVWSPDGTRLSFTHSVFDFQSGTFMQSVNVMNSDGTNQITFNQSGGEIDYNPAWSPNGSLIAFVRLPNDGLHGPDIFTAHPDGTNIRNLTNDYSVSFNAPRWSPDGTKLSFLSAPGNALSMLTVMNADGSGRATISGSVESISSNQGWSPDGSKLAFIVSYGEVYNGIYVVNANGTGLTHIGDDSERNNDPLWSPDSTKLAFTSTRNSQASIDLIQANGTGRVELARDAYSPKWRPAPPPNTPAGSNVALTQNGVRLTFSNVTTAGETTVTPIDPNSLTGVPGEYVINANSLAFEIHTTAVYTGPITIGFQVPGVNNPITFSTLRVLHGEPPPVPNFVDRTVLAPATPAPDFATRTIYARVTSLSPFIVTERKSDATPPVTTATLSAQPNAAGWHKANVNVTLAATDNQGGSGVQSLAYSATGAQVIAQTTAGGSTATIPVTTQGTTTITYRAKDVAGNVEVAKSVTVKLDKTAPAATASVVNSTPNSSGYYNGLNGPVTATLSASDPGSGSSGIAGFLVSATGAQSIPANTFVPASNAVVQITTDGTTTLSYRAVDNAGNEGPTALRTLKVDATAPTTSYTVSSAGANITLTVNFNDSLSGYAAVNYSVNDGQWQVYTGPFPSNGTFSYTFNGPYHESGSYTIKYYGTDAAGNKEGTKTVTFTIPPKAITPTLASVTHNSNGTYTAKFGYRNDNPLTFNIAVGTSNKFSPGNQNRGQTTAFQAGTVANAFTVTWDGSSLTWSVKGPDGQTRSVTARKP